MSVVKIVNERNLTFTETSGVHGGHDIKKVMFTSPATVWIYLEKQHTREN